MGLPGWRRPDPNDGRGRLIFLTRRGKKVPALAVATGRDVEARWAALTSPATIETLRHSLLEVLGELQKQSPDPTPAR